MVSEGQTSVSQWRVSVGEGGCRAPGIHSHHRKQEVKTHSNQKRPEAEKRIPLAWNETHEISFWQEPECD